jgi:hypothetical protein
MMDWSIENTGRHSYCLSEKKVPQAIIIMVDRSIRIGSLFDGGFCSHSQVAQLYRRRKRAS